MSFFALPNSGSTVPDSDSGVCIFNEIIKMTGVTGLSSFKVSQVGGGSYNFWSGFYGDAIYINMEVEAPVTKEEIRVCSYFTQQRGKLHRS